MKKDFNALPFRPSPSTPFLRLTFEESSPTFVEFLYFPSPSEEPKRVTFSFAFCVSAQMSLNKGDQGDMECLADTPAIRSLHSGLPEELFEYVFYGHDNDVSVIATDEWEYTIEDDTETYIDRVVEIKSKS